MLPNETTASNTNEESKPAASTGNASNPSPQRSEPAGPDQLIDKKGETYLREGGNIEDMPDAAQEQEADELMKQGKELDDSGN